jgi:hypothetical protein
MQWLPYFLSGPNTAWKIPHLVLITHSKAAPRTLRLQDIRGAVLMMEYRIGAVSTGIFCTDDSSAFRTVIAPVKERASIAAIAAQALLKYGAQIVLTTYDDAGRPMTEPRLPEARASVGNLLWSRRQRPVARTMVLEKTYEATLARLGKSTRFNLGYYRRRLLARMPCTFIADARGMLTEPELRAVNASCLNPVPFNLFKLQYASACHLPGGFLIGLRGPLGEWLSLIGGWRQDRATVLYWQSNTSGHERASLGTVMRSFFIESEIARGTRALSFYGGTPHSMQHAFVQESATDLVVRRSSWRAALLVGLARAVVAVQRRMGHVNFVLETISTLSHDWRPVTQLPPEPIADPLLPESARFAERHLGWSGAEASRP